MESARGVNFYKKYFYFNFVFNNIRPCLKLLAQFFYFHSLKNHRGLHNRQSAIIKLLQVIKKSGKDLP